MSRIDRYIGKTVLVSMLLVLLVLAGLDLIFTLFDEISDTGEGYGTADAALYVCLTLPRHLYELLPMSALIGAIIGLGVLASSNELVVMQAAGVRVSRLAWCVMKPAMILMVAGLCLGEFVAPALELRAELGKALAKGEEVALSSYGHWERDGSQFIHFNAIDPEGILHGITIFNFDDDRQLDSNTRAERAVFHEEPGQPYWLLENVQETVFRHNADEILSHYTEYDSRIWNIDLTPDLLRVLIIDTDKMAVSDLHRYASRFESQGQDARGYYLAFWKKVLQPLTTAVLVLVAISFVFGPLREATMGSRIFVGICFGLLFLIVQRLLNTVSLVYQFDPMVAVLLPLLLSGLIGCYLLRRAV